MRVSIEMIARNPTISFVLNESQSQPGSARDVYIRPEPKSAKKAVWLTIPWRIVVAVSELAWYVIGRAVFGALDMGLWLILTLTEGGRYLTLRKRMVNILVIVPGFWALLFGTLSLFWFTSFFMQALIVGFVFGLAFLGGMWLRAKQIGMFDESRD